MSEINNKDIVYDEYEKLILEIKKELPNIVLPSMGMLEEVGSLSIEGKEFIIGKVIGLFAVSGLFFLIGVLSKGAWMGGGDVKLMAAAGFVLGWKAVIVSLFLGAFSGVLFSIVRKIVSKKEMSGVIPFGPFLAIGIMLSAFVGEYIFNLYINMFI